MKPLVDSQHLACLFNKDEAVWRRFEEKRLARHQQAASSNPHEDILDQFDWLDAGREIQNFYPVAIGKTP